MKADNKARGLEWLSARFIARPIFVCLIVLLCAAAATFVSPFFFSRPRTILVLGSDQRIAGTPSRSDAILLLRIDPATRTIRGLSLPRDLYVPISGLPVKRTARINAAMFYGDYYGGDGLSAARQTVSDLLDVNIDGVVVVYFEFLKNLVDSLGGIEVYCEDLLQDDLVSAPLLVRFEPGWNYLNGARALVFARMRRPDLDFGRMRRNRQLMTVLMSEMKKPRSLFRLPGILARAPAAMDTDLGPVAALRLLGELTKCSREVRWYAIDKEDVINQTLATGAKVLVPAPEALREAGALLSDSVPMNVARKAQCFELAN